MSITPNFWQHVLLTNKRIIVRNTPIIFQANNNSLMVRPILSGVLCQVAFGCCLPLPYGYKQIALIIKGQTAAIMPATARGFCLEYVFNSGQLIVLQTPPDDRCCGAVGERLSKTQIDQAIGGKVWMGKHIKQASL